MKVKDPVCGMLIEQSGAVARSDFEGTTYYFCSEECKRDFDQNPERYLEKPVEAPAH